MKFLFLLALYLCSSTIVFAKPPNTACIEKGPAAWISEGKNHKTNARVTLVGTVHHARPKSINMANEMCWMGSFNAIFVEVDQREKPVFKGPYPGYNCVGVSGIQLFNEAAAFSLKALLSEFAFYPNLEMAVDTYWASNSFTNKVSALETVESQLLISRNLPCSVQQSLKDTAAKDYASGKMTRVISKFVEAYDGNDFTELDRRFKESFSFEGCECDDLIFDLFLKTRNTQFTDIIEKSANTEGGSILVIVGVGHLIGRDSVVAMLNDRGFVMSGLKKSLAISAGK